MAPLSPRPKAGLHNHAGLGQRPLVAAMRSDGAPCRGFVIFVTVHVLETPLHGRVLGWTAFVVMIAGLVITAVPLLGDQAAVLFTFYPPMWAQAAFYLGLTLVVAATWLVALSLYRTYSAWRLQHPDDWTPWLLSWA